MDPASLIRSTILLAVGLVLGVLAPLVYARVGYGPIVVTIWLAAILAVGAHFFGRRSRAVESNALELADYAWLAGVIVLFIPLYFVAPHSIPVQMNNDETTVMDVAKTLAETPRLDLFGNSHYFGFPSFILFLVGKLCKVLGEVALLQMRLVHATFALAIVALGYLFFRLFSARPFAAACALLIGSNHALVGLSRQSAHTNTSLFLQMTALYLLLRGWRKRCPYWTFCGGLAAGLSLYFYLHARIIVVLWVVFMVLLAVLGERALRPTVARLTAVCLLGFALVAAPQVISTIRVRQVKANMAEFERQRFLFYPEGREHQRQWVHAKTVGEGVKRNIWNGLTAYNNVEPDHGWKYVNMGHGFLDPFTGVVLWIGVLTVLVRKKREEDYLVLGSFLFVWLALTFVINEAPNYHRLLVTLPFVAYLAITGMQTVASRGSALWARLTQSSSGAPRVRPTKALVAMIIVAVIWNLTIYGHYARQGLVEGHAYGNTARYVEKRHHLAGHAFLVVSSEKPGPYYYDWNGHNASWVRFYAGPHHLVQDLRPETFLNSLPAPPFTVFMTGTLWQGMKGSLLGRHPLLRVHYMTTNGSHLAIELASEVVDD